MFSSSHRFIVSVAIDNTPGNGWDDTPVTLMANGGELATAAPEPTSLTLLGTALLGLGMFLFVRGRRWAVRTVCRSAPLAVLGGAAIGLLAFTSAFTAHAGTITYAFVDYGYPYQYSFTGLGTYQISGTIITDGTLGQLEPDNIIGGSLTVTPPQAATFFCSTETVQLSTDIPAINGQVIATASSISVPAGEFSVGLPGDSHGSGLVAWLDDYYGTQQYYGQIDPCDFWSCGTYNGSEERGIGLPTDPLVVATAVPEPTAFTLLTTGLLGLGVVSCVRRWRRTVSPVSFIQAGVVEMSSQCRSIFTAILAAALAFFATPARADVTYNFVDYTPYMSPEFGLSPITSMNGQITTTGIGPWGTGSISGSFILMAGGTQYSCSFSPSNSDSYMQLTGVSGLHSEGSDLVLPPGGYLELNTNPAIGSPEDVVGLQYENDEEQCIYALVHTSYFTGIAQSYCYAPTSAILADGSLVIATAAPEPTSLTLFGTAVLGLVGYLFVRRQRARRWHVPTVRRSSLVFAPVVILLLSATQLRADQITYDIVNYPSLQNGYTIQGTITTDGTMGTLTKSDITGWSIQITNGAGTPQWPSPLTPSDSVFNTVGPGVATLCGLELPISSSICNNLDFGTTSIAVRGHKTHTTMRCTTG
jgi:hypothetical protein